MKRINFFRLVACLFMLSTLTQVSNAQSCPSNMLADGGGYYGGFEASTASLGTNRGSTDLTHGSAHGNYQVVSNVNTADVMGGGYLDLAPHSGNYMMLIHTDDSRLWYKSLLVVPGQTLNFAAWMASAKAKPANGFEVQLRVKYGTTTAVIASSVAQQGKWSQISGSVTVPEGVSTIEFQLIDPYPNTNISNFLFLDDICLTTAVGLYPDFNVTYVNVPVTGSVRTNDVVPGNAVYGTPVADDANPGGANIDMNSDGNYTFSAANTGTYIFQVPVCNASQSSNCPASLLTITVLKKGMVMNPPVANTDHATTKGSAAVTLNTLANDAAGYIGGALDAATVMVIAAPKNGTATVNPADGRITYKPTAGFSGNDTLRYRVLDRTQPAAMSATAYQIITVKAAATANITSAADDYAYTQLNTPVSGSVKLNDSDPEGHAQTATAQSMTIAGKGTLVLSSTGDFTFTPAVNFAGPVSFVYTTCDNGAPQACTNATLYVLVQLTPGLATLPVQNLSFSGKAVAGKAQLSWATEAEHNTSLFRVEHSTDGKAWQAVGEVKSSGSSNARNAYSFLHANAANSVNYYRLEIVDANGSSTVSNTVVVRLAAAGTSISNVYPNPFRDQVQIALSADASTKAIVQVMDMNGRMLQQTEANVQKGENLLIINNLEKLTKGTYIIKMVLGDTTLTTKIFK